MRYTCAVCGGIFKSDRPDEEAIAEMKALFGDDVTLDQCDSVCDDCFEKIKPSKNPRVFSEWQAEREANEQVE